MSRKAYYLIILAIYLSLIKVYASKEEENQNKEEDIKDNSSFEPEDPLSAFNFTNVIHLDDSNYTEAIKKYEYLYLIFYAPWCGHCHQFLPIYIETANYCKEKNLSVIFAKIDGSVSENASIYFQIEGFPSLFFFKKGEKYKYNGMRTKKGLLYYMKRKMSDDIYKINKLEEMKEFNTNIYNYSLALLSTIKDKRTTIYKSFEAFAKQAIFIDFFSCLSNECFKKYGEDIILFKNFDEKENRYFANYGKLDDAKIDSVRHFTSIYCVEMGAFLQQNDLDLIFEFKKKSIFYIRNSSIIEDTKYDTFFKKLARELRIYDIYTFISSTDGNNLQKSLIDAFSIAPGELPSIFYYDVNTGDPIANIKLYSMRHVNMKKINFDTINNFIEDIKAGKIKRDLYSELSSESKVVNGMKYVIGRTYDEDVINEKKNVFLAMIEGNSNEDETNFMNIFGNLTQKYQKDEEKNIKFNFMDINKNEPRDIDVNDYDFPRAYLFTNALDKKEVIKFTPKNMSQLTIGEFENFLSEKLNWNIGKTSEREEEKKEKSKEDKKNEDL